MVFMSDKMKGTANATGVALVSNSVEATVSAYMRSQGAKLARLYLPLLTTDSFGQSVATYVASQEGNDNDCHFCVYVDRSWFVTWRK